MDIYRQMLACAKFLRRGYDARLFNVRHLFSQEVLTNMRCHGYTKDASSMHGVELTRSGVDFARSGR